MNHIATAALALALALPSAASAQDYPCLANQLRPAGTPNYILPPPDQVSSATWQQLQATADGAAMQRMAGVWARQELSPQRDAIQYVWYSFESGGAFQYRDQTCGAAGGPCSQNGGPGMFRAVFQQDGSIFLMVRFSDLSRQNQCHSMQVRFPDAQTMQEARGGVWQRVQ